MKKARSSQAKEGTAEILTMRVKLIASKPSFRRKYRKRCTNSAGMNEFNGRFELVLLDAEEGPTTSLSALNQYVKDVAA